MNEENIQVITDVKELYDKCENMEQLFDKYYLPLLDKHYSKTYKLQQENQSLKKENKILRENTEHNDKVVDKVNWENQLLKKENEQLKDNWNMLKEWVNKHYDYYMNREDYIGGRLCFTDMKNKMKELEGSDSNVKK